MSVRLSQEVHRSVLEGECQVSDLPKRCARRVMKTREGEATDSDQWRQRTQWQPNFVKINNNLLVCTIARQKASDCHDFQGSSLTLSKHRCTALIITGAVFINFTVTSHWHDSTACYYESNSSRELLLASASYRCVSDDNIETEQQHTSCSMSWAVIAFSTFFLPVSCNSPPTNSSSSMKYVW